MDISARIKELAMESTFTQAGCIAVSNLNFFPEVRTICEGNSCRNYGTSWACPPAIGTLEECKARVKQYDSMLLFSKKYELEDPFDLEGMTEGLLNFKQTVDVFHRKLTGVLSDCLLLSNEGCGRCETCTYPAAPCRFPDRLYHSIEGYGFAVNELAAAAGLRYNNGANTVTFFGALLFNAE